MFLEKSPDSHRSPPVSDVTRTLWFEGKVNSVLTLYGHLIDPLNLGFYGDLRLGPHLHPLGASIADSVKKDMMHYFFQSNDGHQDGIPPDIIVNGVRQGR